MLPDEDSVYVATGICSMPEEDRAPRPAKGSAPWPAALLCIWGWPGALSKTKDDLRVWCRGTGVLFKLRNFLTPDGSRLSCVVRAKSPYDPTFFAPRRIE